MRARTRTHILTRAPLCVRPLLASKLALVNLGTRWIPLVRVGLPKSNLNGKSSAMDILLMGARLDYFHAPTSSWKAALEEAELSVR